MRKMTDVLILLSVSVVSIISLYIGKEYLINEFKNTNKKLLEITKNDKCYSSTTVAICSKRIIKMTFDGNVIFDLQKKDIHIKIKDIFRTEKSFFGTKSTIFGKEIIIVTNENDIKFIAKIEDSRDLEHWVSILRKYNYHIQI